MFQKVVPIHYNTFDLIRQDGAAWGRRVVEKKLAEVHLLKPGDSLTL